MTDIELFAGVLQRFLARPGSHRSLNWIREEGYNLSIDVSGLPLTQAEGDAIVRR